MKITAIKQQVKRADRYSIYGDGKYLFSFSENELLNSGIKIGQDLDKDSLEVLNLKAVLDKAYDRSLNLISRRMRSEWEVRDYLKRKEYNDEVQDAVIERLMDRGYVNDFEFAKRWVENRRTLKSMSKRRLSMELRQKRVDDGAIREALDADETDELEIVKDLVERKRKQSKYKEDTKLMQYLVRQGFAYDLVKRAMSQEEL